MKRALPMNSIRSISGEVLGTKRLSTKPARNAPKMPSRSHNPAVAAESNTMARVKVNWMTGSLYLRKNTRMSRGSRKNMPKMKITNFRAKNTQNPASPVPLMVPEMPARKSRAESSATIVAATEMVTEGELLSP